MAKVTLTAVAAPETPLQLTAARTGLLVLDRPLVEGTRYIARDGNVCRDDVGPRVVFTAGPAATFPTQLGTLTAVPRDVGTLEVEQDASCSMKVTADQMTIRLEVAPEAAPWFDVLHFETWVDDQRWSPTASSLQRIVPGTSWIGRGTDLLYRVCGPPQDFVSPGLAPGKHVVTLRATLPGFFTVMSSSTEVELACPDDPPPTCSTDPSACGGGCSTARSPASWLLVPFLAFIALIARKRTTHPRRRNLTDEKLAANHPAAVRAQGLPPLGPAGLEG